MKEESANTPVEYEKEGRESGLIPAEPCCMLEYSEEEEDERKEIDEEEEEVKPPVAIFLEPSHEEEEEIEEEEDTLGEVDEVCEGADEDSFILGNEFSLRVPAEESSSSLSVAHPAPPPPPPAEGPKGVSPFKEGYIPKHHYRRRKAAAPLPLYRCSVCDKTFSQSAKLEKHMDLHSEDKPYECGICKLRFMECGARSRHVRVVHAGERNHRCDECGKRFSQSYHLAVHARSHSGEKPHACPECGKSFTRAEHVTRHMVLHSGQKPHECEVCRKRFSHSGHLSSHLRIHTGEKPHECAVCHRRFAIRGNLLRHMRLH